MAISETTLKDVMLMLIEAQNKAGGVMGRKLEAVVVDPASNWPLFAEKGPPVDLVGRQSRAATFGCWNLGGFAQIRCCTVFESNSTAFCSIRCNTKVRNAAATCSIPARRRTSRRSRPSITCGPRAR